MVAAFLLMTRMGLRTCNRTRTFFHPSTIPEPARGRQQKGQVVPDNHNLPRRAEFVREGFAGGRSQVGVQAG
jgi:hypothetical protein